MYQRCAFIRVLGFSLKRGFNDYIGVIAFADYEYDIVNNIF